MELLNVKKAYKFVIKINIQWTNNNWEKQVKSCEINEWKMEQIFEVVYLKNTKC